MLPNAALKAVRSATSASPRSWVTGSFCPTSVDAPPCQSRSAASKLSATPPPLARRVAQITVDVRFDPARRPHETPPHAHRPGDDALDVPIKHGPSPGVTGGPVVRRYA